MAARPGTTDGWTQESGASALRRFAPQVADVLDRLVSAVPVIHGAPLASLARGVCARTLSLPALPTPETPDTDATSALEFAEQFAVDVSMIDDAMRTTLHTALGDQVGVFVQSVYVADWVPRVRAGLDALFDAPEPAWPVPVQWDTASAPWPLIQGVLVEVARVRELDPLTTEVVRLYQARQHNCRLCKSLRNRTALLAGGDESVYAEIDDYRGGALSPRHKAAIAFAEALTWQPGHLDAAVIAGVRAHFSPTEAVELAIDMMRNSCNKISVAMGTDGAHVADGVEIYDVNPDGSVDFGLTPPS